MVAFVFEESWIIMIHLCTSLSCASSHHNGRRQRPHYQLVLLHHGSLDDSFSFALSFCHESAKLLCAKISIRCVWCLLV